MRTALAVLPACLILVGCGSANVEPASAPDTDDPGMIVFTGADWKEGGWARAIRPDGTGMRPFELREACEFPVDFSADGKWAVCQWVGREDDIYVMGTDGSEWRRVPLPPGYSLFPSLSPDGKELVFLYTKDEYGDTYELWRAEVDGKNAEMLVGGDNFAPDWSPDGERIAFTRAVSDLGGCSGYKSGELVVTDAKGGDAQVVVTEAQAPEWAPDGKRLAFLREESPTAREPDADSDSYLGGPCEVWTIPVDGGKARLLAGDVAGAEVAWSPDGSEIAFLRNVSCPLACRVQIFVAPAAGGKARPIGPDIAETASIFWLPGSAFPADKATLDTFARTWQAHARTLKITRTGNGREWLTLGLGHFVFALRFHVSQPRGTPDDATATATVTAVRIGDRSVFSAERPAPRVGESRTIRLRDGVITGLTGAHYYGPTAGDWIDARCGA